MEKPRRDRDGEIFQDDLTTNEGINPSLREPDTHDDESDPGINSQEDDAENPEFAQELRKSGHADGH